MKSLKEAGQRIDALEQIVREHYSRVDQVEDRVLRALAHTRWTPVLVLFGVVIGFLLARWLP